MNNLEKLIKSCKESSITEWAEKQTHLTSKPWLAYISVTNACNHKCVFCAHPAVMRDTKGNMTWETFKKIVDELPDTVLKVYLMKQGEPFINKNLEEMALYLREKKPHVHISLHTNAVLVTRSRLEKLLPLIDSLGISIDSMEKELYHEIHKKDDFDLLMKNIKLISDVLLEMPKDKRPHVFLDYIHIKANQHETEEEVFEFFSKRFPGLNSVDFHWENNYQGVIEEANLSIYEQLEEIHFPQCVFPWSSITFLYDGKVSYCFVESREDVFLGDIHKQNFEEIWNGKPYLEFRKNFSEKKFSDMEKCGINCGKCSWLWQPKVQSPKNLAGGYTGPCKQTGKNIQFGDVLEQQDEELFELACNLYLAGETHQALGLFNLLMTTSHKVEIKKQASELATLCHKILMQYRSLGLQKKKMKEESNANEVFAERLHQDFKNHYREINKEG